MSRKSTPRAAVYARVSQDKRAGRSVAEQEAESTATCVLNGWAVTRVYRDNDVSASRFGTKARPQWAELVADLDAGKVDVLVLWEPSRGSRDLMTWAALLDACRRQKVLVHVTSHAHTYDLAKPRDWRSLAEDGVDSAYESEKASQRIMRAMHANAVAGRPHGRVPFGYVRRYDPLTKQLVGQEPDPATAPVVKEIVERVARAVPVITITDDLNARGVPSPTGKQWYRQVVRRVAASPAYAGVREYDGQTYEASWEPLVDAETFYAAKRVLDDPARRTTKPGRVKHLLSYLARCGVCGAPLNAAPRKGKPTYWCPDYHVSILSARLDEIVSGLVLARLDDEGLYARLSAPDDAAAVEARAAVAGLRERLSEFRDAAAAGELTPASLAHVETKLLADIARAEKTAEKVGTPAALRDLAGPGDLADRWQRMAVTTRREIVAFLLEVTLDRANGRGRHAIDEFERVRIEWKAGR